MWNSSTSLRTPGKPIPRLPEVEKPSRSACSTSAIPGPSSRAVIWIPLRAPPLIALRRISPLVA
jgi:hypothetical protein